jgi:Domain of unknown function (DUF4440)
MRVTKFCGAAIIVSLAVTCAAARPKKERLPLPSGPALTDAIRQADSALFEPFFEGCDPARLATMLTPDLEFYHDRDGVVATSAKPFVAGYAKSCEARKKPNAWRSRRALVTEGFYVDPVPAYGAIESGTHLFYERQGDGPEKLVGKATFTMLWKFDGGRWKLARVMSYGHKAVEK